MSGGSYEYLFNKFVDIFYVPKYAEKMLARLERTYPESKAYKDFKELLESISYLEAKAGKLYNVLYEVEWCDSGDTTERDVREAIDTYENLER